MSGTLIVFEVQYDTVENEMREAFIDDLRLAMRKARIGYAFPGSKNGTVALRVLDGDRLADARSVLKSINPKGGGAFGFDVRESGDQVAISPNAAYRAWNKSRIIADTAPGLERRLGETGIFNYGV